MEEPHVTVSMEGEEGPLLLHTPVPAYSQPKTIGDEVISRVKELLVQITASPEAPTLNELAAIIEAEEDRYEQQAGHLPSNTRSSYTIGRLVNIIRDEDELYDLVSRKLLLEPQHSIEKKAAAARLYLACMTCWMFQNLFEDGVLEKVEEWVADDTVEKELESGGERVDPTQREVLRTYATGLLALALAGEDVVDGVVRAGLVGHLIRYLRIRTLGPLPVGDASAIGSPRSKGKEPAAATEGRKHAGESPHVESRRSSQGSAVPSSQGQDKTERGQMQRSGDGRSIVREILRLEQVEAMDYVGARTTEERESNVRAPLSQGAEQDGNHVLEEVPEGGNVPESDTRAGPEMEVGFLAPDKRLLERSREERSRVRRLSDKRTLSLKESFKVETPSSSVTDGGLDNCDAVEPLAAPDMEEEKEMTEIDQVQSIAESVSLAMHAAAEEARCAQAPAEVIMAAVEAAAESVTAAASEAVAAGLTTSEILVEARKAADAVVNASKAVSTSQAARPAEADSASDKRLQVTGGSQGTTEGSSGGAARPSVGQTNMAELAQLRTRYCVQALASLGEYLEVLGPVLQEKGVDVCLELLRGRQVAMLGDVLKLVCALAAHRKFAILFVDKGGLQLLLEVPRVAPLWSGISICLFALASLQGVMDRVCALPHSMIEASVALGLQLLSCSHDPARKNAALFFGASFVFPVILEEFMQQRGLETLLSILQVAVNLRGGGSGGTGTGSNNVGVGGGAQSAGDRGPQYVGVPSAAPGEVLTAAGRQVALHACGALRQYLRAHLVLLVDALRPAKVGASQRGERAKAPAVRPGSRPMDVSSEAVDAVIAMLQKDRRLGPAFIRVRWAALERLLDQGGVPLLLELIQVGPGERSFNEIALYALGCLQIVTLMPYTHRVTVGAQLSNERCGMAAILDTASAPNYGDCEVQQAALHVLVNLLCPPASLCSKAPDRSTGPTAGGNAEERPSRDAGRGGDHTATGPAGAGGMPGVGDRRISLGAGTGGPGLASYMEQTYRQAREAVRASNGIKVLLNLLNPRLQSTFPVPSLSLDCTRALACRVLLGLARDPAIAHILTKLQLGRILSELLRDLGNGLSQGASPPAGGSTEHAKWRQEFQRAALELIAMTTNAGRASTAAASEAAAPTLRRIERAAIAAATPVTYPQLELLQLIHGHLVAHGLEKAANALLQEAHIDPLPGALPPLASGQPPHPQGAAPPSLPTGSNDLELDSPRSPKVIGSGSGPAVIALLTPLGTRAPPSSFSLSPTAPSPPALPPQPTAVAAAAPTAPNSAVWQNSLFMLTQADVPVNSPSLLPFADLLPNPALAPSKRVPVGSQSSRMAPWPCRRPDKALFSEPNGNATGSGSSTHTSTGGATAGPATPAVRRKVLAAATPGQRWKLISGGAVSAPAPRQGDGTELRDDEPLPVAEVGKPSSLFNKRKGTGDLPPFSPRKKLCIAPAISTAGVAPASLDSEPCNPAEAVTCGSQGNPPEASAGAAAGAPAKPPQAMQLMQTHPYYNNLQVMPSSLQQGSAGGVFFPPPAPASDFHSLKVGPQEAAQTSLDDIVTAWLKHQHRQCPAPITTLPPLSLLHPHTCPEPRRVLDAPLNAALRLGGSRPRAPPHGGPHGRRHDRHLVYSRFRPWRTCRADDALMSCAAFMSGTARLAVGTSRGEVRIFETFQGTALHTYPLHSSSLSSLQATPQGTGPSGTSLLLSSSRNEVRMWDTSALEAPPMLSFSACRGGVFSHNSESIAAVSTDFTKKEVLLYDASSGQLQQALQDLSPPVGSARHWLASLHFSPLDTLLLWNGALWDPRIPRSVHRFDLFTDYGGGGFHPAGNEVILNSEVWDLRTRKLLRSVPSLDQTSIKFNATGDVIYATLRRNGDDVMAALSGRRRKNPLYQGFRTLDAVNYNDIAFVSVERCVLDLALEPSDSFAAVVAMDEHDNMESFARLYEVGRRRPMDDDSDPDDGDESNHEDESDGDEDEDDDDGDDDVIREGEAREVARGVDWDPAGERRGRTEDGAEEGGPPLAGRGSDSSDDIGSDEEELANQLLDSLTSDSYSEDGSFSGSSTGTDFSDYSEDLIYNENFF